MLQFEKPLHKSWNKHANKTVWRRHLETPTDGCTCPVRQEEDPNNANSSNLALWLNRLGTEEVQKKPEIHGWKLLIELCTMSFEYSPCADSDVAWDDITSKSPCTLISWTCCFQKQLQCDISDCSASAQNDDMFWVLIIYTPYLLYQSFLKRTCAKYVFFHSGVVTFRTVGLQPRCGPGWKYWRRCHQAERTALEVFCGESYGQFAKKDKKVTGCRSFQMLWDVLLLTHMHTKKHVFFFQSFWTLWAVFLHRFLELPVEQTGGRRRRLLAQFCDLTWFGDFFDLFSKEATSYRFIFGGWFCWFF